MSKNYTNLVVFGGAFCMIFLSAFYMYQIVNDTEALTNAQKLWKSIPAMAISFMGVAIFVQRLLHQKEDKELNKERKDQQQEANKIQEENNQLRIESNNLLSKVIKKDEDLIEAQKEYTTAIHDFGKQLNDNTANDNKVLKEVIKQTGTINNFIADQKKRDGDRDNEIQEIKEWMENHDELHKSINQASD